MKETVEIVTATKELIDHLLLMDTHNRAPKKSHVEYIKEQILKGRWVVTNQGVGVSSSGWITDGGHRLRGIKEAGYPPVRFALFRNLDDNAQKYVDQHSKRNMADTLTLFFDQYIHNRLIAVLNVRIKAATMWTRKISPDELINEFQTHQGAITSIMTVNKAKSFSAATLAGFLDVLIETKDDRVIDFMDSVVRGEMLQAGAPALTLRNWLASTGGATGGSDVQRERYRKTRVAVEAFLEGRRLHKLYAK